ncbi:Nramp family divalent metal transporter [Idiomarina sp. PL1-037]|uniref:Nramp family divalent metal transporter n=1 Tax=Idiomarina TaxID=135575 RepID=UPI00294B2DAE|nr:MULTISPECIES: Nramp family divalent metal transporter [unclassified Idiomarina]WQC52708.1 Nramp family divalent metal transporter [Idiomarina sp. PL1-037]
MKLSQFGPGALVAAAFIGPGTVVTASLAGADYGYALLWALVFSVFACLILQEMSARIGLVTQAGLGENIRNNLTSGWLRCLALLLIFSAIAIGNSVYQGGNLSGASLGAYELLGPVPLVDKWLSNAWAVVIGVVAFLVLWSGNARVIEKSLIAMVLLMSVAFLGTFFLTDADWADVFNGIFVPSMPSGATLTVVALIGTTVVPYNIFLHASSISKKWQSTSDLPAVRRDLFVSIPLGGLISMAIVATAASAFFGHQITISSAADLAVSLEPLFGDAATYLMAIGLFAAGISSATTAPLASAYALNGIMGWSVNLKSRAFRAVWLTILVLGVAISSLGIEPVTVIWFAQVANGVLLPVIVGFLWWLSCGNLLGQNRNSWWQNLLAAMVFIISVALSARSLGSAFGAF